MNLLKAGIGDTLIVHIHYNVYAVNMPHNHLYLIYCNNNKLSYLTATCRSYLV
jgi:hypothetical protein